jgi:hypothetical protein
MGDNVAEPVVHNADYVAPALPGGVWLAYYSDWSGMAVFATEIEALRYAVEKSMIVSPVVYGVDLKEAVR